MRELIAKIIREGVFREYPLDDINNWHADADYDKRGGKLILMSPDRFLSYAAPLTVDDDSRENIDHLKSHIMDGGKLDPLTIYSLDRTKAMNSDGRHRAIASKELGIKRVPVIMLALLP